MRGTDSLENVIGKVHELSLSHYDQAVPVADMEFDSLDRMKIAGQEIEVMPSAQRLFSNRLRVPYSYLTRCPEDLQRENLNHWLREEAGERDTLFCRFAGDRIRAVFTERYEPLDHMEILSRMLESGFASDMEIQYVLDDSIMVLKAPDYERRFNFDGDQIVPGVGIANSEVGILAFSIEAYFYRLVCSNGLMVKTSVASRFKHISRKGMDEFPGVLNQVVLESARSQGQLRLSVDTPVADPAASMAMFNRQFQVSKEGAEAVEWGFSQEPGNSMFYVINAYTRAAHSNRLSPEDSYHLERVGGYILSMVKH